MTVDEPAPVLIVGAGPVGTTLAMDLARLGVDSIIVEKRRGIPPNPKCNTTNARSMELFRRLGCADAIRNAGLPADHSTDVVYMTRLNGVEITRYERSTPADVGAGTQHGVGSDWPTPEPQHFISQLFLEPVLRRAAAQRWGIEAREGWELVDFDQDSAEVTATIRDVDTGTIEHVRSRFLVGADGASSLVRNAIGARLEGIEQLNNMCSTYFRSSRVSEIAQRMPGWMLRSAAGRAILVAIDGADGWLIHVAVPRGADPDTWDPQAAMFAAVGEPFEYTILDRSRWTPRAMVANRWRDRSVFLAGDAAHLWVPMGGFGMNAGIADATGLSWRLAAMTQGWGGDVLADSYQAERAPIGAEIADQAVTWAINAQIHLDDDPEHLDFLESDTSDAATARGAIDDAITRDTLSEFECPGFQLGYVYTDSPIVCPDELTAPADTDVVTYTPTTWPGARLPHVWLDADTSIFDRLGDGFTLVRVGDGGPSGEAISAAANAAQVPLDVIDVDATVVGDTWDGASLILVRPDQHVAWRAITEPSAADAAAVIARVTGH